MCVNVRKQSLKYMTAKQTDSFPNMKLDPNCTKVNNGNKYKLEFQSPNTNVNIRLFQFSGKYYLTMPKKKKIERT